MARAKKTVEQKQYDKISAALRQMIKESPYGYREISALTGWSIGTISNIVNKPNKASFENLRKLVSVLDVSVDLIFIDKAV